MKDLFDTHISPMLIAENVAPFADKEYVYEIKWDGERCVAFLDPDDGVRLENKRNVRMLPGRLLNGAFWTVNWCV